MLKNVGTNSHVLGDTACKAASLLEGVALPLPHPVPADLVPRSTTPNFRVQIRLPCRRAFAHLSAATGSGACLRLRAKPRNSGAADFPSRNFAQI